LESITVALQGGMGNQLFGFAHGFKLARENNCQLRITGLHLDFRGYQLSQFGLQMDADPTILKICFFAAEIIEKLRPGNKFSKKVRKKLENRWFDEIHDDEESSCRLMSEKVLLKGYYQDLNRITPFQNEIKFFLIDSFRGTEHYERIKVSEIFKNFIAVHIRRGDYLNFSDIFLLPDKQYYEEALLDIQRDMPLANIVVFTDDISTSLTIIPEPDLILGPESKLSPAETVMLMSQASAIVGANSTFSWWAGFLSMKQEAEIIFPWPWHKEQVRDRMSLIPEKWKTIRIAEKG